MASILILDTCSILDLVRAPARTEFSVNHVVRAREILAAAKQTNPCVRMIVSNVVQTEFQRNLPYVLENAEKELRRYRMQYRHVLDVFECLSDVAATHCVDEAWIEQNITHGRKLAEELINVAAREAATDQDQLRGTQRVWNRIAPAEQANNNVADCINTETALRIAAANYDAANAPKVVFFSSNTADFCDPKKLKPALQKEFDAVALQYARNWEEAWAATVRVPAGVAP